MRECPFCSAGPDRQRVVTKWSGSGQYVCRRVAYVRCLSCNARGPIARGPEYDVRNERPELEEKSELAKLAMSLWDGPSDKEAEKEFKLESEPAR